MFKADSSRPVRWGSFAVAAAALLVVTTPAAPASAAPSANAGVALSDVPAPSCVKIVRKSDFVTNYKYTAENHCQFYQVRVQFKFRATLDSTCKIIDYGKSASTSRGKLIPFDGLYNC